MFAYDREIIDRFPTIRAGVVHATGLTNGPSPPELLEIYRAEQASAAERLARTPIAEIPSIAAWRRAFSAFGVKPTQYRCAPEALLRRLARHGDVPSINLLVDLGNLVSIRHALPVAVCDQSAVNGRTTVRIARGDERFTDLGAGEVSHPAPGEVIFADDAGLASARRWCWRQSEESAAKVSTTHALIVVEAHHDDAEGAVRLAVDDLVRLLATHQREAEIDSALLSPAAASFESARLRG